MCVSPISIYNPTRRYYRGLTPFKLLVPCNRCESCRTNTRNDWFVRAKAEYDYYTSIGGSVWFITLTYNDEHLPRFKDTKLMQWVGNGKCGLIDERFAGMWNEPCFSRPDIQKFLKRLRINISRGKLFKPNGKPTTKSDSLAIKYLICSEYGSAYGRPHYHGAIFLPFDVNEFVMKDFLQKCWSILDEEDNEHKNYDTRQIGFVSFGSLGGKIIDSRGIKYVCKYVTKDWNYFHKTNVLEYKKLLEDIPECTTAVDFFRSCMPFHLQSKGFGLPLLQKAFNEPLTFGLDKHITHNLELSKDFVNNSLYVDGEEYVYRFPQYIVNKVLKESIDGVTHPSSYAYQYFKNRYDTLFANTHSLINKITSQIFLNSLPIDTFKNANFKKQEFIDELQKLKKTVPLRDLSIYYLVYRNIALDSEFDFDLLNVPYNDLMEYSFDFWLLSKTFDDGYVSFREKVPSLHRKQVALDEKYSTCNLFNDFETVLKRLELLLEQYNKEKDAYNRMVNETNKQLKDTENYKKYAKM